LSEYFSILRFSLLVLSLSAIAYSLSMFEVPFACEDHRDAVFVGRGQQKSFCSF
jgi:hypothetical protein